jgi:hypothetical protein
MRKVQTSSPRHRRDSPWFDSVIAPSPGDLITACSFRGSFSKATGKDAEFGRNRGICIWFPPGNEHPVNPMRRYLSSMQKCNNAFMFNAWPRDLACSDFILSVKRWISGSLGSTSRTDGQLDRTDEEWQITKAQESPWTVWRLLVKKRFGSVKVIRDEALWPIADPLHAFQCQKCILQNERGFRADRPIFSRAMLDSILWPNRPLTDCDDADEMNDVLTTQPFRGANCTTLWSETKSEGLRYLLPFVLWDQSIANPELPPQKRVCLIEATLRCIARHP